MKLEIIQNNIRIKQHSGVTCPGCILEETMSEELKVYKVISKVNARLKFLNWKNKFLTPNLRHLLCNALIQPHLIMLHQNGILIFLKTKKQYSNFTK